VSDDGRVLSISSRQARRLAVAAQGLAGSRPAKVADRRHLRRVLRHTGLLQIDSVNVLTRAHYVPAFSRLGAYPTRILDDMTFRHRELFEYWGHAASYLPVELHPLLRWRMHRAEAKIGTWKPVARFATEHPDYVERVYDEVVARGPVGAGEIARDQQRRAQQAHDGPAGLGPQDWGWNWSGAKLALEYLFWAGRITTHSRPNFERRYDLPERVLPRRVLDAPTPDEATAHRELLAIASRSLGVATIADLADYYRLTVPEARPRVAELVEAGRLVEVAVEGWRHPAYTPPDTTMPRRAAGSSLLVPFDPLIWERDRTERLFGFSYRIEIYVPAAKRVYGYYVLPFLLDDALVARVDLKADRTGSVLRVKAAYAEPSAPPETAAALAAELRRLAGWLALDDVAVSRRGDLAAALAAALRQRG
jgi:uncharacterized protein YcaQ